MMEFLNGKKTYLMAAGGAIVVGLYLAGMIDEAQATAAMGFFGFGSVASLRAGVAKSSGS